MTSTTMTKVATQKGIRIKSRVRAGLNGIATNHNQLAKGVRVKSRVKAGGIANNHSQATKGVRVKSHVKAGSEMVVTKTQDCNSSLLH